MAGTYIYLPPMGSIYYSDPVDDLVDLPATDTTGTIRLVKNLDTIYWFNGTTWVDVAGASASFFGAPVNTVGDLPGTDPTGTIRLVKNLGVIYWFNGATWESTQDLSPVSTLQTATQAANTTTGVGLTGVYGSVTSLSLDPGFWQIQGQVGFNENGAVITDSITCGISDSATGVGISEFNTTVVPFILGATVDPMLATPLVYANLAVTTTYYLNSRFNYTSGTPQHRGRLQARLL